MRDDMKLYNLLSLSDWKYGDSVWIIPEDEDEGYLSVAGSNEVLGVIKNNVVILQTKEIIDNEDQLWIRRNYVTYSRVHISSDTAFFKILKKPSIVQK